MGLPDRWTLHGRRKKAAMFQSNSKRYAQIGNGAIVPVFAWVGRRIATVETTL